MNLNTTQSVDTLVRAVLSLPLFLLAASPASLSAQTLSFAYAQTTFPAAGISGPNSPAFDAVGNVYVVQSGGVVEVPVNGGTAVAVPASSYPYAVDSAGNVFLINGSQVLKQPFGGTTKIPVGSFNAPAGVAVDGQNNVFVTDNCSTSTSVCYTLSKVTADGAGAQSQIPVNDIFGAYVAVDKAGDVFVQGRFGITELPAGGGAEIAVDTAGVPEATFTVDQAGNIYFTEPAVANRTPFPFIFEKPANGGAQISLGYLGQYTFPEGLVVDSQGTIYIAEIYGFGIQEIQRTGAVNFQNVNFCAVGQSLQNTCSETATLFFNQTGSIAFGTPRVLSGGVPSSDFTVSIPSPGSESCGVPAIPCALVTFTPQAAGLRTGTVQIVDTGGNILTTVNVRGNGIDLGLMPFITGQTPGPLRNNYTGFVGFEFNVGSSPLSVYALGYLVNPIPSSGGTFKLVQANGTDVPGGAVTFGSAPGVTNPPSYAYGYFNSPVTLLPHTSYFLVAEEYLGSASWYDYGPVVSTADATVLGPAYTDGTGKYVTGTNLPGNAYVPLNFLYTLATSAVPLAVNITSPIGGTLTGTVSVTVSTTGAVATLQLQVDGVNQGGAVTAPSAISLDTTQLANGTHTLTVVGADPQSHTVTSSPVSVYVSNQSTSYAPFVTAEHPGALRNNYTGFVGFGMTVGSTPIVVSYLGRYVAPGNSATHLLKLVNSNGTDVSGGSVSLTLAGTIAGNFTYAALANAITLQPNTTYFLLSQETAGGDQWYDFGPVTTTSVASVAGVVYLDGGGHYVEVTSLPGQSYVPLSFLYGAAASSTLTVTITSPQGGASVTGNHVPVTVTTSQSVTGLQLLVDGVNQGSPVSASPLTLDTTTLSNSAHTLTVAASANGSANAVSPPVTVIVNNSGGVSTEFITGQNFSTTRNNYTGFVGTQIKVGATPLSVVSLGRFYVAGNSATHIVKLVQANGTDVPGGSVSVSMAGGNNSQFVYATLPNPVSLAANTTYYVVSQETAGGDFWYDLEPVTGTSVAQILSPAYTDSQGTYVTASSLPGYSYVPVSFRYQ